TITDANYCSRIDTFIVASPAKINLTPTSQDVSCYGGYDGWATVSATGGSGIYFFNWQPTGQNNATASNLMAGNYTVTATDTKGCLSDTTITIGSPPQILITPTISPVTCYGFSDGAISTVVTQGVAPYQYLWVDVNQVTANLVGLIDGPYALLITDALGCQELDTFYVTQPDSLIGELVISAPSCPSAHNGGIVAVMQGGTTPYTYEWNNNPALNTPSLDNLSPSYFVLLVTDANGCYVNLAENVKALPDLAIDAGLDVSIELGQKTILNAQVDRFGDFNFRWRPPYNLSDSLEWSTYAFPFVTTDYIVEVLDPVTGCKGSDNVTVTILPSGYVLVPSAFSPNNDGLNDVLFPVYGELVIIEAFKIFNRWGQVVFSSKTDGWDGNFKGKPEETATYVYDVRYRIEGRAEQSYETSGSVVLIR
ncbi:MAG: gliding motility-associated C-terminal domain-containing protein, partial [Chitinophagales bacterium]